MKTKRVTLDFVKQRSLKDKCIFDALLKDPAPALKSAGWTLSPKDLGTLKQIIKYVRALRRAKIAKLLPLKMKPGPWPDQ